MNFLSRIFCINDGIVSVIKSLSKSALVQQRETIIELISEKVSCLLGGNPSQADLIEEAKKAYKEKPGYSVTQTPLTSPNSSKYVPRRITKPSGFYKNVKLGQNNQVLSSSNNSTSSNDSSGNKEVSGWSALNFRAKMTVLIFLFGTIFWGILIVVLIMKMF